MGRQVSSWLNCLAVFMFAAATFSIVDGAWVMGVTFFAAATCFASVAKAYE